MTMARHTGRSVIVTGAAGAIGFATGMRCALLRICRTSAAIPQSGFSGCR
jgi:hypothetical protein